MRRSAVLVLAVSVAAVVVGCGKKATDSGGGDSPTKFNIEGTYVITGMEKDGEAMPAEFFAKAKEEVRTIKITADKMIATKNGKEDPLSYKIDASKTPHEIDMTEVKQNGKEETTYGIVKLEGDTLTICGVESDKVADRPKEFKTTKENKAMIMILKKKQ